ncbi:MAG: vWA domain-containing protein [Sedimentisphaerales bacterium]
MARISKLFEKTDGLLLRCLGLTKPVDTDREPTQISQGTFKPSDCSSCPWDTAFVLDRSTSMTYKDCRPSRLAASQHSVETYVRTRAAICPNDRVAIVSFALSATIELPLTSISNIESIINAVWRLRGNGGTDMATGINYGCLLLKSLLMNIETNRVRRILLLTDGRGGNPLHIAEEAKNDGILLDVIGIGGKPSAVDEPLLRRVATTDADGLNHYWFIKDTDSLVKHYQQLATSLVWRSGTR